MPRSSRKSLVIVLWLRPVASAAHFLQETIDRLAAENDGPQFQPHLTLGVVQQIPPDSDLILPSPIALRPIGVFQSSVFTKTLFIRFQFAPALERLQASFGIKLGDYDPHLSLLYRNLRAPARARLAASITLPFQSLSFDRLAAIRCPSPTTTPAEVEAFEVLASPVLLVAGK